MEKAASGHWRLFGVLLVAERTISVSPVWYRLSGWFVKLGAIICMSDESKAWNEIKENFRTWSFWHFAMDAGVTGLFSVVSSAMTNWNMFQIGFAAFFVCLITTSAIALVIRPSPETLESRVAEKKRIPKDVQQLFETKYLQNAADYESPEQIASWRDDVLATMKAVLKQPTIDEFSSFLDGVDKRNDATRCRDRAIAYLKGVLASLHYSDIRRRSSST